MDSGFDKIPIGWFQKKIQINEQKSPASAVDITTFSVHCTFSWELKKGREMEGVLSSPQKRMFTANSKGQKRSLWLVIRGH